jgi:50S ribosomal protein L16 3-hydroxylase
MSTSILGDLYSAEEFLRHYWQKRPLLLRNTLPHCETLLTPEELAGFACEDDVDSRIVSSDASGQWHCQHGPFIAKDFARSDIWTLLVQNVDKLSPAVASLIAEVLFLPTWRFDDVMVSYAVDGGGVGPHFDRYDVFLVQGQGQRIWRTGPVCDDKTPMRRHPDLRLLDDFQPENEWLLNPGDVLYIPPGVAHWGIAVGDCMTYSIGFRAPRVTDLIARLTDSALEDIASTHLLADRDALSTDARVGEITQAHLANAKDAALNALRTFDDPDWFGALLSEGPTESLLGTFDISSATEICKHSEVQLVWYQTDTALRVYCNGEVEIVELDAMPWLIRLCRGDTVALSALASNHKDLLTFLIEQDALMPANEFDD